MLKTMNFHKNIIVLVVMFVFSLMTSCSDDFLKEDPKGNLANTSFTTKEQFDLTLSSSYAQLAGVFNAAQVLAIQLGDDCLTSITGSNKSEFVQFDTYDVIDVNERAGNIWYYNYQAIRNANMTIINLDNAELEDAVENQIKAEASFIRATAYFWLVRVFGSIPLNLDIQVEGIKLPLTEPRDIYAQIVEDLQFAEEHLEETTEGVIPSQGAAKAMLAEVYLTMAGWPLELGVEYYAFAASKAKEVIDNEALYGFRLLENYADLWSFAKDKDRTILDEGVFNMFFLLDAEWPNLNMLAPNSGRPSDDSHPVFGGGWSDYMVEVDCFNEFPGGARKNATFTTQWINDKGVTINWRTSGTKHPYLAKWREADDKASWNSSRTVMVLRYAHVLLTYAEAQARANGADASAYMALNRVRKRAGLTEWDGLTKEDFIDRVVAERKYEFIGEPHSRWYDMLRLQLIEEVVAKRNPDELPLFFDGPSDYYAQIPLTAKLNNPLWNLK